ncbi:transposase [Streptomyces hygroscopicus]|uniref:transposase n=1 Tax=Streptomyces hygroscopicus TaxID=1912 RepID=UPI00223F7BD2|nr:transposase [Streptomyces hygroscopicus]
MAPPSRDPLELRRRAVRMVAEVRDDYPDETAAWQAVADKLGIGSRETLRNWVKQHEIDAGKRPGTTTEESAQIKASKKENAELKRANEILQAAACFARPHPARTRNCSPRQGPCTPAARGRDGQAVPTTAARGPPPRPGRRC